MSTGGPETREQQIATQRSILGGIQRRNQDILESRGIVDRAIASARNQLGNEWEPELGERTPETRFVVSRGAVYPAVGDTIEHLYVTRFQGDERQWGAEVGTRNTVDYIASPSDDFRVSDVALVGSLINSLARKKSTGELSHLNFDCDRIG